MSFDSAADIAIALADSRYSFTQTTIQTLSYGAYLPLAIMGIQAMLRREKRQWITLTYSLLMLILTTAWYTTTTYANEVSLVELRYNPDNKNAEACVPVNIAATAVSSLQFALSDLLLLYRVFMVWNRSLGVVLLPALTWLAYIGIAIAANLSCTSLALNNFGALVVAYYSLSVLTNSLCTGLICVRILSHRRSVHDAGISSSASLGLLATTLAESGFFYALAGIVNIVTYVRGDIFGQVAIPLFNCMAFLTQAHVILRIALGIDFRPNESSRSTASNTIPMSLVFRSAHGRSTLATDTIAEHEGEVWAKDSTKQDLASAQDLSYGAK